MSFFQNSSKVLPGLICLSIRDIFSMTSQGPGGRRAVKPGALWILANVSRLDVGMLVIDFDPGVWMYGHVERQCDRLTSSSNQILEFFDVSLTLISFSSVSSYHQLLKTFSHPGSAQCAGPDCDRGNVSNRPSAATERLSWQGHRLHASMETCNLVVCNDREKTIL